MGMTRSIEIAIGLSPNGEQEETWQAIFAKYNPNEGYEPDHYNIELGPLDAILCWCYPKGKYDIGDEYVDSDEFGRIGPWGGFSLKDNLSYEDGCTWEQAEAKRRTLLRTAQDLAREFNLSIGKTYLWPEYN